ncbi:MAG TPA: hypothetical protein PK110_03880 [Niabella sp.]|mgnify:CR=1 FL=1|nr:hypothetical protein [Chitinophagaceae bacterium]HRN46792.1 hypothetical protein [Niabella sp.]HRO83939.1 hypothetical protein [Niabella sp.]
MYLLRNSFFVLFFQFFVLLVMGQEAITVSAILNKIDSIQKRPERDMTYGLFNTHRKNLFLFSKPKTDNNAFYTGLVVNVLRVYKDKLDSNDNRLADSIINRALPAFKKFKHKKGKPSYFFWAVDTPRHFPNSFLEKITTEKRFLPDDADCSAILLEAANASDIEKEEAHALFQKYAGSKKRKPIGSQKKYRKYDAYSTWLGYAIAPDYDMCVHTNILRFVDKNRLDWTAVDSATAALLAALVEDRKHISQPGFVAPYYGRTSIILYHLSRWMKENQNGWMSSLKPELVEQAKYFLNGTKSQLEVILLRTALLWWNEDIDSPLQIDNEKLMNDKVAFFRGNVGSYLSAPVKRVANKVGLFTFNFYCPSFNEALLLQYLMEKELKRI